jgi:hypothetical protein
MPVQLISNSNVLVCSDLLRLKAGINFRDSALQEVAREWCEETWNRVEMTKENGRLPGHNDLPFFDSGNPSFVSQNVMRSEAWARRAVVPSGGACVCSTCL